MIFHAQNWLANRYAFEALKPKMALIVESCFYAQDGHGDPSPGSAMDWPPNENDRHLDAVWSRGMTRNGERDPFPWIADGLTTKWKWPSFGGISASSIDEEWQKKAIQICVWNDGGMTKRHPNGIKWCRMTAPGVSVIPDNRQSFRHSTFFRFFRE